MANSKKIIVGLSLVATTIFAAVKGYSFFNKAKNAINNIQFMFSFVRVQGLIGDGIINQFIKY